MPLSKEKARENSNRCVEYWIKRGHTVESAKIEISKVQSASAKKQTRKVWTEEEKKARSEATQGLCSKEWFIAKYGEVEGSINYNEFDRKRTEGTILSYIDRRKEGKSFREQNPRCIEFWIKRGFSEKESKRKVSLHQSTSTLPAFVKKYGETEGLKRWQSKLDKWYKSMYLDKSVEELEIINNKRKLNSHVGYYTEDTIRNIDFLYVYIITFIDTNGELILKYGLTKFDNIYHRWEPKYVNTILMFEKLESPIALQIEQTFNKEFRHSYSPSLIKTTECTTYSESAIKYIIQTLQQFGVLNEEISVDISAVL